MHTTTTALPTSRKVPGTVSAVLDYARRHGWSAEVTWSPADVTNTGDGWVATVGADTARGRGEFRLVWRYRGTYLKFERYYSEGRAPGEWREAPTLVFARWAMRNNPVPSASSDPVRRWRETDALPPSVDELTAAMLAQARYDADKSHLPQTVFASRWIGREFLGADCLLTSAAMPHEDSRPGDAHPDSTPLLTVLPSFYFRTVPAEREPRRAQPGREAGDTLPFAPGRT
ncbi:hypothetical protein [Kitasatospora sp. NPDC002965]|uniref:hypothetical protein n=1 Tax=Kitasatospora sp. NPDC002965 TaxID=3154775 RepID=UPI0033AEFB5E